MAWYTYVAVRNLISKSLSVASPKIVGSMYAGAEKSSNATARSSNPKLAEIHTHAINKFTMLNSASLKGKGSG
jgi:hypothetical protein